MTRIHDMGGRYGQGPVKPSTIQNPEFEKPWHARALAITLAAGALGKWNLDATRHARECLPSKDYLGFSYYEKWLAALVDLLIRRDIVSESELAEPEKIPRQTLCENALSAPNVAGALAKIVPTARKVDSPPRFHAGCKVRTRRPARNTLVISGHTRLPVYAAGCTGTVIECRGIHILPDSNAHFLGEAPEPLYSVAFKSIELWGSEHDSPNDEIIVDLWESYLTPAE